MALTGRVLAERSSLRFHVTAPRAITPGLIVAIIALTIPATIAAVAPAEPTTTIDSGIFSPVKVSSTLPAPTLPGSAPAFAPAVPAADLALEDIRVTAKRTAAAIREEARPRRWWPGS